MCRKSVIITMFLFTLSSLFLYAQVSYEVDFQNTHSIPWTYHSIEKLNESFLRFWKLNIEGDSLYVKSFTMDSTATFSALQTNLVMENTAGYGGDHNEFFFEHYETKTMLHCYSNSFSTIFIFEDGVYENSFDLPYEDEVCNGTVLWDTGTFLYIDGYDVMRLDLETGDTELIYTYDAPNIDQGTELFSLNNDYLALMVNGGCIHLFDSEFNYLSENVLELDWLDSASAIPIADGYIFHFRFSFDEYGFYARIVDNELVVEDIMPFEPQADFSQFNNPVILNQTQFLYENHWYNQVSLKGIVDNEITWDENFYDGKTVAAMEEDVVVFVMQDSLHRLHVVDRETSDYRTFTFRQSATSSYWSAQTLGEHVYFFSGTSLIYEYTVHRLVPVNDDDVPSLDDSLTNYPNPFNPTTTIAFSLAEKSNVELSIYNIKGQKIKTLVSGMTDSGEHRIEWDGLDSMNKPSSSGVYFYRLKTAGYDRVRKMILIK